MGRLTQEDVDGALEAERVRRIREDSNGNGQTLASVKTLKGMLQVQIPAKYAIPAFMALLGLGGGQQLKEWKAKVDTHINTDAPAGFGRLEQMEGVVKELVTRMTRMERAQREQWYRDAYRARDESWMSYLETQDPELRELRMRMRSMERAR